MSDYIHLIGAEQVQRAANEMTQAAETIRRSANQMDATFHMALDRIEQLVERIESALTERSKS